ncbi:MAG: hypothetical protein LBD30_00785 [Verrucomicrobiales bacterium]|jgi:hypothetical protein|nr:hypothetical protein [Verrucomicrobiales bacterium]
MPLVEKSRKNGATEMFNDDAEFELPVNPEIEQKIADYKKAHPRLAATVKQMPRERLENAYILHRLERGERFEVYRQKVVAAMDKPENQELKQQIEDKLQHVLDPKVKARLFARRAVQAAGIGSVKMC